LAQRIAKAWIRFRWAENWVLDMVRSRRLSDLHM
jgi:hypothetical protein